MERWLGGEGAMLLEDLFVDAGTSSWYWRLAQVLIQARQKKKGATTMTSSDDLKSSIYSTGSLWSCPQPFSISKSQSFYWNLQIDENVEVVNSFEIGFAGQASPITTCHGEPGVQWSSTSERAASHTIMPNARRNHSRPHHASFLYTGLL